MDNMRSDITRASPNNPLQETTNFIWSESLRPNLMLSHKGYQVSSACNGSLSAIHALACQIKDDVVSPCNHNKGSSGGSQGGNMTPKRHSTSPQVRQARNEEWREREGVEPTAPTAGLPPTMLKTAGATRPHPLPGECPFNVASGEAFVASCQFKRT